MDHLHTLEIIFGNVAYRREHFQNLEETPIIIILCKGAHLAIKHQQWGKSPLIKYLVTIWQRPLHLC